MKSRQRIATKCYRIIFSKLQAVVFALVLLARVDAAVSLGLLGGGRGASSEVTKAEVAPVPKALKKDGGKEAERRAFIVQKKIPEPQTEVPNKPADVIQPKFYQDLLKENQDNEQPIEPIKLPVVRKEMPSKPKPPLAAAVGGAREKDEFLEKKTAEKKENANGSDNETRKQVEAAQRDSKPWTKAGGYTIQVVSVKKFDVALRVFRKLRDAGFKPLIKKTEIARKGNSYSRRGGDL
ncbi:MAG: hypothetical protein OXL41_14645, partial [Nitrospinae bacterium]|nr:hypothetical protein [Nitrospinota bacterium]